MNPYQQEALDKNPFHVLNAEIEARIAKVAYDVVDFNNATRCTITFDNDYCVHGVAARPHDEIAQTMAYQRAVERARELFEFQKAEKQRWLREQAREAGMLATLGQTGGL